MWKNLTYTSYDPVRRIGLSEFFLDDLRQYIRNGGKGKLSTVLQRDHKRRQLSARLLGEETETYCAITLDYIAQGSGSKAVHDPRDSLTILLQDTCSLALLAIPIFSLSAHEPLPPTRLFNEDGDEVKRSDIKLVKEQHSRPNVAEVEWPNVQDANAHNIAYVAFGPHLFRYKFDGKR